MIWFLNGLIESDLRYILVLSRLYIWLRIFCGVDFDLVDGVLEVVNGEFMIFFWEFGVWLFFVFDGVLVVFLLFVGFLVD